MKKYLFSLFLVVYTTAIFAQTNGTLTVTATTSKTTNGNYSPKNILAIWIEDANGNFVKTLMAYASERKQYLVNWKFKTTIASTSYNTTDAITGATLLSHGTRTATWNGKNRTAALVADGTYSVRMEVTDNDGFAQNLATFSFVKGTTSQTLTPSNTNGFSGINIQWAPVNTAINELPENELLKVYVDKNNQFLIVQGEDVKRVDLFDITGKMVLRSQNKTIYINAIKSGIYFVNIKTNSSNYVRKFIKR